MSKKVCLYHPSKKSCTENRQIGCSVCKTMSKSKYYVCKSGRHVICEDCNSSDTIKNRNDNGDKAHKPVHECDATAVKEISCISNLSKHKNLASGDHIETVESLSTLSNTEVTKNASTPKSHRTTNNTEATVNYVNKNYNDSESSIASSNILLSKSSNKEDQNCERINRPVKCPVTYCARMVTIESFFIHFNFDHSKVSRMILNDKEPQEILINYSTLSIETKCLAVLIISNDKRSCESVVNSLDSYRKSSLFKKEMLLLMAARMPILYINSANIQHLLTRNSCTQTDENINESCKFPITKNRAKTTHIGIDWMNEPSNDISDEIFLLWLCTLDNKERVFTVTVSRTDKKQGYSYIGDAVHITDQHDPFSIYKTTKCLSITKAAIDKLIAKNELEVLVSLIK